MDRGHHAASHHDDILGNAQPLLRRVVALPMSRWGAAVAVATALATLTPLAGCRAGSVEDTALNPSGTARYLKHAMPGIRQVTRAGCPTQAQGPFQGSDGVSVGLLRPTCRRQAHDSKAMG